MYAEGTFWQQPFNRFHRTLLLDPSWCHL